MVKFDDHLNEIKETQKQIGMTKSPQRKYQLHRRLNKLLKDYSYAKLEYQRAKNV